MPGTTKSWFWALTCKISCHPYITPMRWEWLSLPYTCAAPGHLEDRCPVPGHLMNLPGLIVYSLYHHCRSSLSFSLSPLVYYIWKHNKTNWIYSHCRVWTEFFTANSKGIFTEFLVNKSLQCLCVHIVCLSGPLSVFSAEWKASKLKVLVSKGLRSWLGYQYDDCSKG